jgi:hypothetical protein
MNHECPAVFLSLFYMNRIPIIPLPIPNKPRARMVIQNRESASAQRRGLAKASLKQLTGRMWL